MSADKTAFWNRAARESIVLHACCVIITFNCLRDQIKLSNTTEFVNLPLLHVFLREASLASRHTTPLTFPR